MFALWCRRSYSERMRFDEWYDKQPRGALTRVQIQTGISYTTIHGAKRGRRVQYDTAVAISEATGGKVSVASLCEGAKRGAA